MTPPGAPVDRGPEGPRSRSIGLWHQPLLHVQGQIVSETTELDSPGTVGASGPRRRWRAIVLAATAIVVLVTAATVAWLSGGSEDATTPATAPSTAPPAVSDEETTTAREATAADVLEPFLAAAATLDTRLHTAATIINGGGPPWTTVSGEMADAVQAADLEPVAHAVPAGLPPICCVR